MANINRDYLIVLDAKSSVISDADDLKYYITDEHSQNLFINLVVRDTQRINKYVEVHDPEKYQLELHIVKPNNDIVRPHLQASLLSAEDALYEFELPKEAVDYIGTYKCELRVTYKETDETTITTSNKFKYKVKRSIYNDLDSIQEAPQYPVVIQLFDKLSDIEQYEEDRRANELARQLAEEQRQTRFDVLDADMTNSIQAMDDKVVDVENRITAKEQAVDKLIVDTKADIDEYKVAKDQEIDEYKALKDTEINEAITAQDNKIDTATKSQNDRITVVENNDVAQDNRLGTLENRATTHESRLTDVEAKNQQQDGRLDVVENKNQQQDNRLDAVEAKNVEQDNRLNDIEAIDVAQNTRLDAIEVKNQQQDDRLLDIEKVNKRQDMNLKCLFAESKNNMIDITEEGNSIYLQNSTTGYTLVDEIKGNTLVNCNKEPDKELVLNGNINTSGDNTVTITEGVDGGLVDVTLEGNTLVNVSKTKDSTAITKAYTVENSGNHIALQGEYDGKCRPVVTGKTLVNLATQEYLFEEGCFLDGDTITLNATSGTYGMVNIKLAYTLKPSTTYTIFLPEHSTPSQTLTIILHRLYVGNRSNNKYIDSSGNIFTLTTTSDTDGANYLRFVLNKGVDDTFTINKNIIILEGDYSDKPIPDYFEGLKSTFEDKIVTQEMIDSGEEIADNLGKYRVEYKVTGKNKFDKSKAVVINGKYLDIADGGVKSGADNGRILDFYPILENTTYTISKVAGNKCFYAFYNDKKEFILGGGNNNRINTFTTPTNAKYIRVYWSNEGDELSNINLQIEEGNTATSYEPYKGYTKTLYLNSPLLEGDTIEEKDGGIYHIHRSGEVVLNGSDDENWKANTQDNYWTMTSKAYVKTTNVNMIADRFKVVRFQDCTNGSDSMNFSYGIRLSLSTIEATNENISTLRQYLQQNPITAVYQLASPTYELIEQSNLAIPSYTNGHLDLASAVPVEKVEFKSFGEELTYLYANTQYTLQFISDKAITADITLGGTSLLAQSIVTGLNRISITTPATLVDNKLVISGVGANISEVVVTDTDRKFGYFEGMKSVGECEGNVIEIISQNKNLYNYDIHCAPFAGYLSSRQIQNNGIKVTSIKPSARGCAFIRLYANEDLYVSVDVIGNGGISKKLTDNTSLSSYVQNNGRIQLKLEKGRDYKLELSVGGMYDVEVIYDNIMISENNYTDFVPRMLNTQQLTHEPLRAVGDVKDRYVLIDGKWYIERKCQQISFTKNINYWKNTEDDTSIVFQCAPNYFTNLTNCSTRHGSIIVSKRVEVINITTGAIFIKLSKDIAYDVESFKNYLPMNLVIPVATPQYEPIDYNPLEVYQDITHITTNSIIPTNITVKNHGFNCLLKPSTTYTISSNLGLNTVTTPSTLTEDCLRFMDTDTSDVTTMRDVLVLEGDWTTKADLIPTNFSGIESAFEQEYDAEKGKYKVNVKVANEDKSKENNITFYIDEPLRGVGDVKDRIYVKDDKVVVQRNCGNRAYENGDFGTYPTDKINTVYQLAEPVYEEVEYNDVKLFIESFKNSTLFYNSNVPVSSKLYYSYSVPIVDTVAQTANVTDQQDSMIIDLATQVAVMEMMLM